MTDVLTSDPAVLVTEHGVYSSVIELDVASRTGARILVWGTSGIVPTPVLELVSSEPDYGNGLEAVDIGGGSGDGTRVGAPATPPDPVLATVIGSGDDFEYQLPASPRFFIGRSPLISRLSEVLDKGNSVLVFNAQSGWGKSSLALRLGKLAEETAGGYALLLDARTASLGSYLPSVLRRAALEGQKRGLLELPPQPSWATLASCLDTLAGATWTPGGRPLVIFFDQFENVFRDAILTREFRDLALGAHEIPGPLIIGFAWKTDLVGWTEGHPYQLRDEIRASAQVLVLEPLGPREVETLLRRLEKKIGQRLLPDLRRRLREYSQGLPWLLKKLAGHLIREIASGVTQ
jgi:hypothetical protein